MMLTRGAVQQMMNNVTGIQPHLQILDVKKIVTGGQGERCRLVLSDGDHYIQGMLASQCTQLMSSGQLCKFAVIQILEFVCNNVSGKKICVVINCNVVGQQGAAIGNPKNIASDGGNNSFAANQGNANRPPAPSNQQAFHQRNLNQNNQGFGGNNNYGQNQGNRYNQGNGNGNGNQQRFGGGGGGRGGMRAQGGNEQNIRPVSSLNPYQSTWRIKVRVTKKDTMRHYHNQKGDGKLFGLDFLDKDGTEIRAVCFNETADKFYGVFEKDKVYIISRGSVRLARKGFSHITNDYSITLNNDSEVVQVEDSSIQSQKYNFVQIAGIEQVEPKQFVDVIGVVTEVGPLSTIMSNKTQKEIKRRNLKIADQSAKIDITLWADDADNFDEHKLATNTVVAFKGAKVSDFGGRSLSASGLIDINPDRAESTQLMQWIQQCGGNVADQQLRSVTMGRDGVSANAPRLTFAEVKEMKLGEDLSSAADRKKADYFTVVATITTISHSADKKPWYEANPDLNCDAKNAKVQSMGDGTWRCDKNGKVYTSYVPRYILRFCATDFSGNIWLTSFNEAAEQILKVPATEAERLLSSDPAAYDRLFKEATFRKYVFKCKAFSDYYEDSARVRYDCVAVQLADPAVEADKLMDRIQDIMTAKNGQHGQQGQQQQGY